MSGPNAISAQLGERYEIKHTLLKMHERSLGARSIREGADLEVGRSQRALDFLADPHVFDLKATGLERMNIEIHEPNKPI